MAHMEIHITPPNKFWHYLLLPVSIPVYVAIIVAMNVVLLVCAVAEIFGVRG